MAVQFNEAQFSEQTSDYNYSSEGTLASNAKGFTIKFTKKNLAGLNLNAKGEPTRVTLILEKGNKRYNLSCSAPLSTLVRNAVKTKDQDEVLASLMQLEIHVHNEDPKKYFLTQPKGDGEQLPAYNVTALANKNVSYEDVIL